MAPPRCKHNLLVLLLTTICLLPIILGADSNASICPHFENHQKSTPNWLNHGGDLHNRRYANRETKISPKTVSKLELKWKFFAGKDISATPAIFKGTLYFPSWNGNIYAVKACDGSLVWKQNLQNLTGIRLPSALFVLNFNSTVSRSTPTVISGHDLLVFGLYWPGVVLAVKRSTGKLVWMTRVENHTACVITMSGTYYKGGYYIGTSSLEEGASIADCCTFRGSLVKLDSKTGKILWKTYMLPDNFNSTGGYAGAAVWGSSPSIDTDRKFVFIATGNLYSVPPHVRECQEKENNQTRPTHPDDCLDPDSHSESILALDLDSGKIRWYHQLGGYDVWFVACSFINFTSPECPIPGPNPDADFGEAPMMLSISVNGTKKDIVAAVQKSGFSWALDRDNGNLIWMTEAGPGGVGGGGTWGAATDGRKKVYTNIANTDGKNFTLKPSNNITTSGGWVALDARDGKILWSTADPSNGSTFGPVTLANGVIFAGSTSQEGPVYAMEAKTGKILWSYETGASVYGGGSVSNGCIYMGSGYNVSVGTGWATAGTSLFAFSPLVAARHKNLLPYLNVWIICLQAIAIKADSDVNQLKERRGPQNWINHGGDIYNRRYASEEVKISPETVSNLRLKWEFYAGRDITATPAIFEGTLYFPSWNGYIYAVNSSDGSLIWKQDLIKLTGFNTTGVVINVNTTVSRSTPTIAGNLLIVAIYGPAVVIAVKRSTGRLVWSTRLDSHPAALVTMSGTYHKGALYIGTSSLEESSSIEQCCTFRGSFSKLDVRNGVILWQKFMLPDNLGQLGEYAGGAVWGSSPSIDIPRNLVYIATGNMYSAPLRIRQCQEKQNNQTAPSNSDPCIEPDNHSNSILSLDLDSGKIKWYRQLGGYDLWFFACNNVSTPNCPPGPNPDADFSEAPMMLSIFVNGTKHDIVVAVQKSGFAWALDRNNGNLVWSTEAGPGGAGGGGYWGAATDTKRVYTNIANSQGLNFTLKPTTENTTGGGWVAMDPRNGEILWSVADPTNVTTGASGPVTIANGVLFAGSTYKQGPIYAINAESGEILWSYNTGSTVYGGMSVSNGCLYIGNGYKVSLGFFTPSFTAGTSLFAFCIS